MRRYWKTYAGHCIYEAPSGEKVHQNALYRWVTLQSDALQTLLHRGHPERAGLPYVNQLTLAACLSPGNSCLLGLGGANVAHRLHPSPIIAVENNQEMIRIASRYCMIHRLKAMQIVHQDAAVFVEACQTHYQHVIIDLFNAHAFPESCNHPDFFHACRQMLLPDGILAINLANLKEQRPIFHHIRRIFNDHTVCLPVRGHANLVVLAYNGSSVTPLLSLLKKHRRLQQLTWDPEWGCVAEC